MNLFDLMNQAGGGKGFADLGQQFGLSESDVRKAVEAFAPAFSAGLGRKAAEPSGLYDFLGTLAGGQYDQFFNSPLAAGRDAERDSGNAILGQLFGSKDVSRALANQASAATGLSEAILKQVLPAIAAMMSGGLAQQAKAGTNSPFGEILRQMQGGSATHSPSGGKAPRGPLDRFEDEQKQAEEKASGMPGGLEDMPFGRVFSDILGSTLGYAGGTDTEDRFKKQAEAGKAVFGDMIEPGRQMGEAYGKAVNTIFEQYLDGINKHR